MIPIKFLIPVKFLGFKKILIKLVIFDTVEVSIFSLS
jgi:hypothetical protein